VASYNQWLVQAQRGVRRVTWVCGEERVLVEEIVDHVRTALAPSDFDLQQFVAGIDKDRDVWAAVNTYPSRPTANRLVVVRDVEKVKSWQPLLSWLANSRVMPTSYLLLVSSSLDFDYELKDGKRDGLKPHQEAIKQRGSLVKCTVPTGDDLRVWANRTAQCSQDDIDFLMNRVGGDLGRAYGVLRKCALFGSFVDRRVIEVLSSESPADDYTDSLVALRKPGALLALSELPPTEYLRAIALLDSRLETLAKLHEALRNRRTFKEITSDKGGVSQFLAHKLIGVAKHYDPKRRSHCRQVLALIDFAVRGGARDGTMEALVALW
jgi:DNA polymerase III delta subunit